MLQPTAQPSSAHRLGVEVQMEARGDPLGLLPFNGPGCLGQFGASLPGRVLEVDIALSFPGLQAPDSPASNALCECCSCYCCCCHQLWSLLGAVI